MREQSALNEGWQMRDAMKHAKQTRDACNKERIWLRANPQEWHEGYEEIEGYCGCSRGLNIKQRLKQTIYTL